MKINFKNKESYFLLFILLLAAVLRFYKAFEIPLTQDEFSALFRTDFASFKELIEGGVLTDTHPAGVQLFLFYWIKLTGDSAFALKFPFILMGIGAVYLIWKLAKAWYNTSVAILCSLLLATLEFPLMYSQIARPYISGLFLSLWMVYHWRAYLFDTSSKWNKNWIFYVLASALSAYNHHFGLLFAAIVGLSGLLFINKERLINYALAGIAIFVLYVPHLPIFFYQLDKGGVGGEDGWLGKPGNDFLWKFIQYIFNYSWALLLIALFLFAISLYRSSKATSRQWKLQIVFFLWFFIPFLIGFLYSIYVNPVIQFSVLIFSFPFLFFILFGFLPDVNLKWKTTFTIILTSLLLFTTLVERKYYPMFYNSAFEGIIQESRNLQIEEDNSVGSIIDSHIEISNYFLARTDSVNLEFLEDFESRQSTIEYISQDKWTDFSYGLLARKDPLLPAIIYDYFPVLKKKVNYSRGEFYAFSKTGHSDNVMYRDQEFENSFEKEDRHWNFSSQRIVVKDTLTSDSYYDFAEGQEWGVSFEIPFDSIKCKKNDLIDIRLDVYSESGDEDLLIVSELFNEKEQFDWRSSLSEDFKEDTGNNHYRMYHCIKLSDIDFPRNNSSLKVYVWNKGKKAMRVDDFSIKIRVGNPILYGLLNKF